MFSSALLPGDGCPPPSPAPEQQYDGCFVFAAFTAMTACQAFVLLRDFYLTPAKPSNKPASSCQPHVLYSVLSGARKPIPIFLQPQFWKTALPAAVTVFLLFPALSINMIASPMDSLFLKNATNSAHADDEWGQPTWASHTPHDIHYHNNPSWQWHSRRSFGTCTFNPPQPSHQHAWHDSSWLLDLHTSSFHSASMPMCNLSSSGTNIEQQVIASDLPKPIRPQSKALVAVPEALAPKSDPLVSDSKALVSVSEALLSNAKSFAAPVSEVCMLRAVTMPQLLMLSPSVHMEHAIQPLAISSDDDLLRQLSQAASTSLAPYTPLYPLTEQHAAASSIKILRASESAVDTAANSLILSCMPSIFQKPDIEYIASTTAAAGTAAVLLACESSSCIMQMMPANSAIQATMVTVVADSIFSWTYVTNTIFTDVQYADHAPHHHTFSALSPALVLPTSTPGRAMHSTIIHGLNMHSMIIHGLDMHSMISHEGEHDDKLSGTRMSRQHTVLGLAERQEILLLLFLFAVLCLLLSV